jgi:type IV pilus assembly protein PilQ
MKYKKWAWLICTLLLSLAFSGCAGKKTIKKDPFFEKWKAMAEKSKGYSPAPSTRTIDLPERINKIEALDEKAKVKHERPLPTQKVTLRMYKSNIISVLRALARLANQNILISPNVKGEISINIQNTSWDQVFRGILRTHGLTYTWEESIIRVMTTEDMEQDLKIDAIQEKRKAHKIIIKRVEPLLTRIVNINFADTKELKENLNEFLTKDKEGKPRGSVMVDEHTNSLIIQAIRDDIVKMISLIEKLDRPTLQILIEANIVETTRDTARELGIQWGGLYHGKNYWITPGANAGGVMGSSLTNPINPTTGMAANFPADLSTGAGFTIGVVSEKVGDYLLNIQLSALQKEGKLNILSSPSITTLDNQMAFTENGEKVPYVATDKEGNREVRFEDAVLRLEITPHVIDGKNMKMKIMVKKDEVDISRTVEGNPFIIKKHTETNLIMRDSETIVISGLTKTIKSESESGVPELKDIPILGWLFKSKGDSDKMEEVLIFITPHILKKQVVSEMNESGNQKKTAPSFERQSKSKTPHSE